jgi:hypothetical protein
MDQSDLLRYLTGAFTRLRIPHFVTGSIASGVYGEPRYTNDIDVVADIELQHAQPLIAAFPPDRFYVSLDAIRGAISHRGPFNIIDTASFLKVDVILPKASDFDRQRFARIQIWEAEEGLPVPLISPEDLVLAKLLFYEEGGSEKHIRDITSLLRARQIDAQYVAAWAQRLGVASGWQMILTQLGPSPGPQEP